MPIAALRLAIFGLSGLSLSSVGCTSVQPVAKGSLYRSGQLTPTQLETAVTEHDIRTVVNLRGRQPDAKWYQDQKRLLKQLDVKQVDVALESADQAAADELLATFEEEDKPILVHSPSSKAVGFASTLYRVAVVGEPMKDAREEFPIWYRVGTPSSEEALIAKWDQSRGRTDGTVVASKRKPSAHLEDLGLDDFEKPMPKDSVAVNSPPKRWPWAPDGRKELDAELATVVLGPPKALSDDRIADRAERQRY